MSDLPVSATTAAAVTLWVTALALATVYAVVGTRGAGVFAIIAVAGGSTLTVRRFLIGLADDLIRREHNAFQVGLDAQQIRSIR